MYFAKVIGTIWATRKDENLKTFKLQFLQPLNAMRESVGDPIVAVDTVGAGPGETVFYITAREAVIPLPVPMAPVDASIVGIVDRIDAEGDRSRAGI
ncbi:MAG: EutN/CcmL family microcompartment protein [Bacteroidota bacterium]